MKNKDKYKLDYPEGTLYDAVLEASEKFPNNIAYDYFGKTCTYKSFIKKIGACADSFKATGISKGDVVTICMPNTPEAIIAIYALNKVGAIANIIHPLSAENEIKNYLELSNSVMLLTVDFTWEKVKNIVKQTKVKQTIIIPINYSMKAIMSMAYYVKYGSKYRKDIQDESAFSWGEFLNKGKVYLGSTKENIDKHDPAIILYSGGTSGISKGIILSNFNFNAHAKQNNKACGYLSDKDRVLAIMPIFHGFGLGVCVHTVISAGAEVILIPQFNAKKFHQLLKKYKPTAIVGIPTLYEALLNNKKIQKQDLSFIKLAISGGDSLSTALKIRVDQFFDERGSKTQLREGYGLTECVSACCLSPSEGAKENSTGLPYEDTLIKIFEVGSNKEMPNLQIGEICISGPTVMKGYLNNETETNEALQVHKDKRVWLHTGDLGYMDSDGYLFFMQRLKRLIISSGYNVYPVQIERVLNEHPDVLTSTVVGVPHPYKIEVPKAYIVLKEGIEPTKRVKDSIKNHCIKNIAKFSLPREYEYRKSLPKTKIGKVDYNKLMDENKK